MIICNNIILESLLCVRYQTKHFIYMDFLSLLQTFEGGNYFRLTGEGTEAQRW